MYKNFFYKIIIIETTVLILQMAQVIIYTYYKNAHINSVGSWGINISAIYSVILSILAITVLAYFAFKFQKKISYIICATIGAGLSNIFDRFRFSGVLDYFNLWQIPTFNIADIIITTGVAAILILIMFDKFPAGARRQ